MSKDQPRFNDETMKKAEKIVVTTCDISKPYEILEPVYISVNYFTALFMNKTSFFQLEIEHEEYIKFLSDKGILPTVGTQDRLLQQCSGKAFYIALKELKIRAGILGADAIIGMRYDVEYERYESGDQAFYFYMYGTAVKFLEKDYNQSAMSVQPVLSVPASQNSSNVNVHHPVNAAEPIVGLDTNVLVKRAFLFLEDDNFSEADRYLEQALNQDPENSRAYLGKLMVEKRVHNTDELVKLAQPLDDNKFFKRALRFANDEEKANLQAYAAASRSV